MNKGGYYNIASAKTIRLLGLLMAPILVIYSLLIFFGKIPAIFNISLLFAMTISLLWTMISVVYYFKHIKSISDEILRLTTYHILAIAFIFFVTGFSQPIILTYVLLIMASKFFFGNMAGYISTLVLLFTATLHLVLYRPLEISSTYNIVLTVGLALFLGLAVIIAISAQESKLLNTNASREREKLQYKRMITILNNLSDASLSTDADGRINMYNAACLDLLDTNSSIKGKFVDDIFNLKDADDKKTELFKILKLSTKSTRRDDLSHSYSDGESIRLEITFSPIRGDFDGDSTDNQNQGYILIARDVTKQKSLEEERNEFISVVSHELRTPITIAEGSLSNLSVVLDRPKLPTKKLLQETVDTAHDQVLYLAKMVNDLSTLSRAERGIADATEEIDANELLIAMHQKYQDEAKQNKLRLNLDIAPKLGKVNVSRLYLEELLQNFITNAIKYTKKGSVTISAKKEKNQIEFLVADTGIGISRSDQHKVFDKFYRSEDYRIRETNGTGLGLYVSSKLARKLHTKIELTSRLNYGSTFSFKLPAE